MGAEAASPRPGRIVASGAGFRYASRPAPAFDGLSFRVEPGECLLVLGPSGSGKSTLALALAGLVPRELPGEWRGTLEVDGLDPLTADGPAVAARVGLVFQDPESQLVMERVEDDVAFGLESRGWPREAMTERVPEALEEVGLGGFERRRTTRLSGGQQQRLALAGALAPRPGILVLDEPTANLDPDGARAFADRLAAIRVARAATIVLVEHRIDVAWPLADLVLALDADGRPIDVGRPDEVLARSRVAIEASGSWLPGSASEGARPVDAWPPGVEGDPVVIALGVRFAYDGPEVLRGIDLAIRPGERIALVGANGSGKSTLARVLVGLLRPVGGTVSLGGRDPARLPPRDLARLAGFVFQDPEQQFVAARVRDEVLAGLDAAGDPAARAAVEALMARLGLPLDPYGDRSPYTLSGGEQRRLSLAPALARRPGLLVLDEPTFGQDRRGVEALSAILHERVDAGTAVLAATHDERFVAGFATRVIRLEHGRIVADEVVR